MKKLIKYLEHADKYTSVWAALFSCLTLFSLLVNMVPGWYNAIPSMEELVCGQVIWSGYAKTADLTLVKVILCGLLALFSVFYIGFSFLQEKKWLSEKETWIIGGGYLIGIILLLGQGNNGWQGMLIWLLLSVAYGICKAKNSQAAIRNLGANLISAILLYLTCVSIWFLGSYKVVKLAVLWQSYGQWIFVFPCLVLLLLSLAGDKAIKYNNKLLYLQLILPCGIAGMIHFRYLYETSGEMMELFYSRRWMLFCMLLAVLFLADAVYELVIKKRKQLICQTYVMLAMVRVFMQPQGIMSIDFFHNGELTMPMQQLMSYGRLPYDGIIPIHGLCDYFYGAITYLFFDGSYMSLSGAKIVGGLLMAILLSLVIYYFVDDTMQRLLIIYLFMPYLINQAGMRYLFLFIMFIALFSRKLKDAFWYIYIWVFLSILATAWNASIGGAGAIAFLPIVLYKAACRLPEQVKKEWKTNKKLFYKKLLALSILFVVGICYIPLFARIVEYLLDNTKTTAFVNGMEMFEDVSHIGELLLPGLWGSGDNFFATAFGFVIPILIGMSYFFRKEKAEAREYTIALCVCFFVLFNYAFVRFDEGLRSTVMGMFFTLLIMVTIVWRENNVRLYMCCLGFLLWIVDGSMLILPTETTLIGEVPGSVETIIMGKTVEDPVVYVTGESVDIPNLGNGFIQGNALNSLCNISKVLTPYQQAGLSYLDLTNQIANQVVFHMDNYWAYTSAYNISNDRMQKKAIKLLEENLPQLILVAPEIVFDDAPFSLRSPILYEYLIHQGYETYKYENVIYMTLAGNLVEGAQRNEEALSQLWHKKAIGYLPSVWAASAHNQLEDVSNALPDYRIVTSDEGFDVIFDKEFDTDIVSVLEISFEDIKMQEENKVAESLMEDADAKTSMTVSFEINKETEKGEEKQGAYEFTVHGEGGYSLPLGCTPYWKQAETVGCISFAYDHGALTLDEQKVEVKAFRFKE